MELTEIEKLALDIARCSQVKEAINNLNHPCSVIVRTQSPHHGKFRQVPEAWAGSLETARILMVSSNPSISTPESPGSGEDYPLADYSNTEIPHPSWGLDNMRLIDFQTRRLDQNRDTPYVTTNAQFLCSDGIYRGNDKDSSVKASQKYWKAAFEQARRLLGDRYEIGRDLCMTEIVHCKSKGEAGVANAVDQCSRRYLHRILDLSAAQIVIIGGRQSRDLVHSNFESWNMQEGHFWEIDPMFGKLKSNVHTPEHHVGLYTSPNKQCIVVACQQLSYQSNVYRFVDQVIGALVAEKLSNLLQLKAMPTFANRPELLEYLGLKS